MKIAGRRKDMLLFSLSSTVFDIIEPLAFRKYSTYWVLEKSEELCKIMKKFVYACVVNVIHAKVLPGSVRYIEH